MKKKTYLFSIMTIFILLCVEGISFFATKFLQDKGVFYKPVVSPSYGDYLSKRDDFLGWPSSKDFGKDGSPYDSSGSRIVTAFPDPSRNQACISLYGDSFTWSAEVDDKHAWNNILSTQVGCRVANYGVGGYGSDQAYLRFKQNRRDHSKIVFLNHHSENILRNVNQFRDLLYPGEGLGFKPRFVIEGEGSFKLVPLPTFTEAQYKEVVLNPGLYLKNEYFLPNGPSGITQATFPYTLAVLKAFNQFHVKAKILGKSWYQDFYNSDHPSMGLEVTTNILTSFYQEALARGQTPVLTIIPGGKDLLYFSEHADWPYQNLIDELSRQQIPILNVGIGLMKHMTGQDPCSLFGDCRAHYNEKGYELLATVVYEFLTHSSLIDQIEIHHRSLNSDGNHP